MKERITVTLDTELIDKINELVKLRKYRNRSHVVELALSMLTEKEDRRADRKGDGDD